AEGVINQRVPLTALTKAAKDRAIDVILNELEHAKREISDHIVAKIATNLGVPQSAVRARIAPKAVTAEETSPELARQRVEAKRAARSAAETSKPAAPAEVKTSGGTVRLYRGESVPGNEKPIPDWLKSDQRVQKTLEASGRWFTSDRAEAQKYADDSGNGRITYIDVPSGEAVKYEAHKNPDAS